MLGSRPCWTSGCCRRLLSGWGVLMPLVTVQGGSDPHVTVTCCQPVTRGSHKSVICIDATSHCAASDWWHPQVTVTCGSIPPCARVRPVLHTGVFRVTKVCRADDTSSLSLRGTCTNWHLDLGSCTRAKRQPRLRAHKKSRTSATCSRGLVKPQHH